MIDLDWLFTNHKKKVVHVTSEIYPWQSGDLIRVGAKADGGYVLTQRMFDQADFLISCGLGYEFTFEIDFAKAKLGSELGRGGYASFMPMITQRSIPASRSVATVKPAVSNVISGASTLGCKRWWRSGILFSPAPRPSISSVR